MQFSLGWFLALANFVLLMAGTGQAAAQSGDAAPKALAPVVFPTDVRIEHDVAYLPAGREEKADLYFPLQMPTDRRLPAVVIIPGAPHTFDLQPKQRDLRPLVLEFLDKHLRSTSTRR